MTVTLVLPCALNDEICVVAQDAVETAGVLIANVVHSANGDLRLLGQKIRWVDNYAYLERDAERLSIASEGYVPALAEAEELGSVAIWVHTHPNAGIPRPSKHDRNVDSQIADLFRMRSGSPYYGALIFSLHSSGLVFTGHLSSDAPEVVPVDRLWSVGDSFQLIRSFDSKLPKLSPIFDRNIRAFGNSVQETLGDLNVGIVGCGGTGSSVGEQLVRLGVREFTLIDPDSLSASNITRVYGSTPGHIGQAKVEVLAEHLRRIAPDARSRQVRAMITLESAARQLTSCDVVFGCTDDNAGRLVLSRIPTYLLTPVIDCGVLLTSNHRGELIGIDGRVTLLTPGNPCLVCRNRIDVARASAELLTPEERIRRQDEGYAPALGATEPAVVAFTTLVSATAVSELLERLVGFGPQPRPGEVLLRIHEREISTNMGMSREGHYCHPAAGKIGRGLTEPFLEQTWPT
jgi:molybdopterin/thiamine biosynthesis adenylyltransferase/proteasome lid subunit RPN8/RPN11